MKIELNLNPDEILALIHVLERDRVYTDITGPLINDLDRIRCEWCNDARNLGYLRADSLAVNPADMDAWHRWAEKHRVDLVDISMYVREAEDLTGYPKLDDGKSDEPESNVYVLDGKDNLIDITPHVFSKGETK